MKLSATPDSRALSAVGLILPLLVAASFQTKVIADTNSAATNSSDAQIQNVLKEIETKPPTDSTYELMQRIVSEQPENYRAHLVLGDCFEKSGLIDSALEQYKLAMKYAPNAPEAYTKTIEEQLNYGQTDAAMALLKVAQSRFPENPQINYLLGSSLAARSRYADAELAFNFAEEHSKEPIPGVRLGKAGVRMASGKFEEALQQATLEPPSVLASPLGQQVLGVSYARTQQFQKAYIPLHNAFVRHPFGLNLAELYLQTCLEIDKNREAIEPAIVMLAKDLDNDFNTERDMQILDEVLHKVPRKYAGNDVAKVIQNLERFKNKLYPEVRYRIGEVLDRCGVHPAAEEQYRKAFELMPNDFRPAFHLALDLEVYEHQYDEALLFYQKAISVAPRQAFIRDFYDRLQLKMGERKQDVAWRIKDAILDCLKSWFGWYPS